MKYRDERQFRKFRFWAPKSSLRVYLVPRGTNVRKIRLSATAQKKLPSQGHVMPSASYYRRQADLLLSFAVTTENPVVSDRCRLMAEEYQSLAAMLGDDEPEVASASANRAQAC